MSWIDFGLVDKVTEVMNFSTKVQKWVVKSCSQPPGQLAWARQQMWLRSGPEPVPGLDQSEAEIPRQLGPRPMRGQLRDVRSINGSVRAVRGGQNWDHNIASWGRPSLEDPGVLPTNTCSEKYKDSQKYKKIVWRKQIWSSDNALITQWHDFSWILCGQVTFKVHFLVIKIFY